MGQAQGFKQAVRGAGLRGCSGRQGQHDIVRVQGGQHSGLVGGGAEG